MLKHLDENKQRWQSIANKEINHCKAEQASDSYVTNVTHASIEVMEVCDATETSLEDIVHQELDTYSVERVNCSTNCDESVNCITPTQTQVESRRGSLPTCDTVALVSAGRRRNSAPVISQCAAMTVKKYLLATLAEHSSSFCTQNSSCDSERFFSKSHVGCMKHHVMDAQSVLHHKKSAWSAVAPLNTCVGVEGRPRDRRSNSHALVFRQCLMAGRIPGRRFSSPAVGQDDRTSRDSEAIPLLSRVIPSTTICSHSALVNWFVDLLV